MHSIPVKSSDRQHITSAAFSSQSVGTGRCCGVSSNTAPHAALWGNSRGTPGGDGAQCKCAALYVGWAERGWKCSSQLYIWERSIMGTCQHAAGYISLAVMLYMTNSWCWGINEPLCVKCASICLHLHCETSCEMFRPVPKCFFGRICFRANLKRHIKPVCKYPFAFEP